MTRVGKADLALLKDPDELLNQYIHLRDENTVLKKHNNEQEDKIKKLATKLVRITADLKRRYDEDNEGGRKGPKVRDYRAEERIAELQQEGRELQRKCEVLQKKNEYLQQLVPNQKGQKGRTLHKRRTAPIRQPPPPAAATAPRPATPVEVTDVEPEFPVVEVPAATSGAPASTEELEALKATLQATQQQLVAATQQRDLLSQQMSLSQMQKSPPRSPALNGSRGGTAGRGQMYSDDDYAALQREMREKMTALTRERTKSDRIQVQFEALAANEQRLIVEVENKTRELKEERQKALECSREAALASMLQGQLNELKKSYAAETELREDVEVDNRKLTQKIFSLNSEGQGELARVQAEIKEQKKVRACEQIYRMFSVSQTIKLMLGMRAFLQSKASNKATAGELQISQCKAEVTRLEADLAMFKADSGADDSQLKEMSRILGQNSEGGASAKEKDESTRQLKEQLQENARLAQLLETNKLLSAEAAKEKLDLLAQKGKLEGDLRDLRARRARSEEGAADKLQDKLNGLSKENARLLQELAVLKSAAPGQPVPPVAPEPPSESFGDAQDLSVFEGGEGVLEVSVMHAALSQSAVEELGYTASLLQSFVLVDFASHQPTTTSLAAGLTPHFNLNIEYAVQVDAFFLELLLEEPVVLELYIRGGGLLSTDEASNTPFATGSLSLAELLRHPEQRVLQRVDLLTVPSMGSVARCIGSVQLSAGMRDSIAVVANRFLQQTDKALNATLHSTLTSTTAASSSDPRATLAVHVISCSGLKVSSAGPPSPCVAYQFFNFPPTDTCVELSTANPAFNDLRFFEVVKDNHIKSYLKTAQLDFTVFDDSGSSPDTILGSALVKLEPLLRKDTLVGQFEVQAQGSGKAVGLINVEISWQQPGTVQ